MQQLRALVAICMVYTACGQGLPPLDATDVVGSTSASGSLRALYGKSRSWRRAFKIDPAIACSRSAGSLCAASDQDTLDLALLELATSPAYYDARSSNFTGGSYGVISSARDQGSCFTCAAFASNAAAEAAISSALNTNPNAVQLSDHSLAYCLGLKDGMQRTCRTPWHLREALSALTAALKPPRTITTAKCVPYITSPATTSSASALQSTCRSKCTGTDDPNGYLNGEMSIVILGSAWEMQQHILTHGAAVTSLTLYDDFKPFFAKNPKGVYRGPKQGAKVDQYHAVAVVGFDNDQEYWIAKNSWGPEFADQGFFKIGYGASSIASFGSMFGLIWQPVLPPPQQLDLTPIPNNPDCYLYKTKASDFITKIANRFRLSVRDVLLSNKDVITDLDASISNKVLRLCGIDPALVPPSSEQQALLQLKAQMDRFNALNDWKVGGQGSGQRQQPASNLPQHCSWSGVGCHPQTGRVIAISLVDQTLGGALPSTLTLQGLPELKGLVFQNTGLVGTLPTTYSGLNNIRMLGLVGNFLSGPLPAVWTAGLKRMQELNLANNQLTGTLPPQIHNMPKLAVLNLTRNHFTGPIPAQWARFGGRLRSLDVSINRLTGPLPSQFKALNNLRLLNASQNMLAGSLSNEWSGLRLLEFLQLQRNSLNGTLPNAWGGGMVALQRISLAENRLSGKLPGSWKDNLQLDMVDLHSNQLTGPLPDSWSSLVKLGSLTLSNNALNGTLPASWGAWKSIMGFDVRANRLRGTLPASYGNWGALYGGAFSDNMLSGTLPAQWLNMRGAFVLTFSNNRLSGSLPPSWGEGMSRLNVLSIDNNNFTGPLPGQWSGMQSLFIFIGHRNRLSGTLPASWGKLRGLLVMLLAVNRVKGTLPPEYGRMPRLAALDVRCNLLTGPIPESYIGLTGSLQLSNNKLSGTLPQSWGVAGERGAAGLQELDVANNNITGTLPKSWGLLQLTSLAIFNNPGLGGCLPITPRNADLNLLPDTGTCTDIANQLDALSGLNSAELSSGTPSGSESAAEQGGNAQKRQGQQNVEALTRLMLNNDDESRQVYVGRVDQPTGESAQQPVMRKSPVQGNSNNEAMLPGTRQAQQNLSRGIRGTRVTGTC